MDRWKYVRADVYRYLDDFSKPVEGHTFVDALVFLIEKPKERMPVTTVVKYDRPVPVTNALELAFNQMSVGQNGDGRGEETPSEVSTLTASLAGTAVHEPTSSAAQVNLGNIPLPPVQGMAHLHNGFLSSLTTLCRICAIRVVLIAILC